VQIWGGALVGIFFIFAGLLAPAPSIGPQWYWLYRVDPVAYAMAAVTSPQFYCEGGAAAGCPTLAVPTAAGVQTVVISDYIDSYFGIHYDQRWANAGWLVLFVGVLAVFSLLTIQYVSWVRR
jgi:ABC-type multidrug transport system permease subunit